jgi:hypothetical protein
MGYDKETKRVSVDSFEVAEEKGDGKLGGKRGGKPFYKQTWFLWSESVWNLPSNETLADSGWSI